MLESRIVSRTEDRPAIAHDVFISYAFEDKPVADAVCASLEAHGVRCWIAPRDILPGSDWSAAIIDAIEGARVMVLVFSQNANASPQIIREVERAVSKGLTIMPLRIEDVLPARNLEYFLGTPHWLDAISPPLENHLEYLAETVQFLLERGERPPAQPLPPAPPKTIVDHFREKPALWAIAALPVLLIFAFATGILGDSGGEKDSPGFSKIDPALVGSWNVLSAFSDASDGSQFNWTTELGKDAKYTATILITDAGSASYDSAYHFLTLTPDKSPPGYTRTPAWKPASSGVTTLSSALMPSTVLQMISITQPSSLGFLYNEEELQRTASNGAEFNGTFEHEGTYGSLHLKMKIEVTAGRYSFEATINDSGSFFTDAGKWRQVSDTAGLHEGDYQILDGDSVVLRESNAISAFGITGQVTWKRAR
jgi:hypothetical protein